MSLEASPRISPPNTPNEPSRHESPTAFIVTNDTELANDNITADDAALEDGPSAADYDPTMDMQEDKLRQTQHSRNEDIPSRSYDETVIVDQDVLLPATDVGQFEPAQATVKKPKDDFDMFADEDQMDMFAEVPATTDSSQALKEPAKAVPVPSSKALDAAMLDDWDDPDGYYKVILGELLGGRYHVHSNLGKGMFSGVVRATDQSTEKLVAIKIIRNNETM